MSRKEAINTFTDGMISDLSPLNTPNTVLTDCLNGTLITYDGNELTLQNDKGNYPLKNCKLPPNYIPVGVKEYADILYIVAYNPINKHVQIGSYPSPERITEPEDFFRPDSEENINGFNPLTKEIESVWDSDLFAYDRDNFGYNYMFANYSDITNDVEKSQVFYGNPTDKFLINPGDEYKIVETDIPAVYVRNSNSTYERVQYSIIDENKKVYDVSDLVYINSSDFRYVGWTIPGYMSVKGHVAEIDEFKVNVRKIVSPTYVAEDQSALSDLLLNFEVITDDQLFLENPTNTLSDLCFKVTIKINGENETTQIVRTGLSYINLKNGNYCFYLNYDVASNISSILSTNDTITITVVPMIEHDYKFIVYDKYEKTISFNLGQKGNIEDFNIGESLWTYSVDNNSCIINFNTSGLQENSVMSEEVILKCTIKKGIGHGIVSDINGDLYENVIVEEWNMIGDTPWSLNFVPLPESQAQYNTSKFYPEEYYIFEFNFFNADNQILNSQPFSKVAVLSKLFNGFDNKRYDEIYFDEWVSKYKDYIENTDLNVSSTISYPSTPDGNSAEFSDGYYAWTRNHELEKYKTAIGSSFYDDNMKDGFTISSKATITTTSNLSSDLKVLTGPLWYGLDSDIICNINNSQSSIHVNPYTGIFTPGISNASVTGEFTKRKKYSFSPKSEYITLYDYREDDINVDEDIRWININSLIQDQVDLDRKKGEVFPKVKITDIAKQTSSILGGGARAGSVVDLKYLGYDNSIATTLSNIIKSSDKDAILFGFNLVQPNDYGTSNDAILLLTSLNGSPNGGWEGGNASSFISIKEGDNVGNKEIFFAAFKIPTTSGSNRRTDNTYKLLFVNLFYSEAQAITKFSTLLDNIKYFIKDDNSISGTFFNVNLDASRVIDNSDSSLKLNISGNLIRNKWLYQGRNMLDINGRAPFYSISGDNAPENNFFKVKNNQYTFFEPIELRVLGNDINLSDISSTLLTAMDTQINAGEDLIAIQNNKVDDEYDNFVNDYTNWSRYLNHSAGSYYVASNYNGYTDSVLKILNNEISELSTINPLNLVATDKYTLVPGNANSRTEFATIIRLGDIETGITVQNNS